MLENSIQCSFDEEFGEKPHTNTSYEIEYSFLVFGARHITNSHLECRSLFLVREKQDEQKCAMQNVHHSRLRHYLNEKSSSQSSPNLKFN